MLVLILCAVLLSMFLLLAFLPLSYTGEIYLGRPFRLEAQFQWGEKLAYGIWHYDEGQKSQHHLFLIWRRKKKTAKACQKEQEKAWQELEKDSQKTTYAEIKTATPPKEKPVNVKDLEQAQPLWQFLLQRDFLTAFATWLYRLLLHGQIRELTLSGCLGLPQPHETGILAGLLYAICPGSVTALQFNFIEERYDCTLKASGRLYPGVIFVLTALFLISPAVRRIFAQLYTNKKGVKHG